MIRTKSHTESDSATPWGLQVRLNGDIVQDATVSQMIFDIPRRIEYCSSFTRLDPGDVIATGAPGAVGSRRTPPLWMKPGDVVCLVPRPTLFAIGRASIVKANSIGAAWSLSALP